MNRPLTVIALLGALALVACGGGDGDEDPWDDRLAATVGEVEITEAQVDTVADDLRNELAGEIDGELARLAEDGDLDEQALAERELQRFDELDQQMATTRPRVVEMRVLTEAATPWAEAEGIEVADSPIDYYADELGLPKDNSYVRVVAEFFAVMGAIQNSVEPVEPTEADQREVYDRLVEAGLTSQPFEQAQGVLTEELMGQQLAIRNVLREAVDQAGVEVNPKYDLAYQVPVSLGESEVTLPVPLG